MAQNTKIEWCDDTFNPWIGCARFHRGCVNCYAETLMDTRYGRVEWGVHGTRSRTKTWGDPPRWDREARASGVRRRVFCASLADVFEDRAELEPWRRDLWQMIDGTTHLDWLMLSKRPENIRCMWGGRPHRPNVWRGTSPCDQETARACLPALAESNDLSPIAFLSAEPLLGPIELSAFASGRQLPVHWVIVGGESGHGARPLDLDWVRDLVAQCRFHRVPLFVKQLGANPLDGGRPCRLRSKKGGDAEEWPEEIRVREFPAAVGA